MLSCGNAGARRVTGVQSGVYVILLPRVGTENTFGSPLQEHRSVGEGQMEQYTSAQHASVEISSNTYEVNATRLSSLTRH